MTLPDNPNEHALYIPVPLATAQDFPVIKDKLPSGPRSNNKKFNKTKFYIFWFYSLNLF